MPDYWQFIMPITDIFPTEMIDPGSPVESLDSPDPVDETMNLYDSLDELIELLVRRVSVITGKSPQRVQKEIDQIEDMPDDQLISCDGGDDTTNRPRPGEPLGQAAVTPDGAT
jgi:hypothetical protein